MNIPEIHELRVMYDEWVRDTIAKALELGFRLTDDPDYEFGGKLGLYPNTFEEICDCYDLLEGMRKADLRGDLDFYFWCERFLLMQYQDWYKEERGYYKGTYWE